MKISNLMKKMLQNPLKESNIFLKKLDIKVSLEKKNLSISPINTRKVETLQKSVT